MTYYTYPSPNRDNGRVSVVEHQDLAQAWGASGVWDGLEVSLSGTESAFRLLAGSAYVLGERFVNTDVETLPVTSASSQRIARLVLRLDRPTGLITPTVLLAAGEPALTHSASTWDLPLARAVVPGNSSPTSLTRQEVRVGRPYVTATYANRPGQHGTPTPVRGSFAVLDDLPHMFDGAVWKSLWAPTPVWSAMTFHNGASDVGGSTAARYYRDPVTGQVHLKGAIRIPTGGIDDGLIVARLPVQHGPSGTVIFRVTGSNNELYRLLIRKDNPDTCSLINDSGRGLVSNGFIELDGISWFPGQ